MQVKRMYTQQTQRNTNIPVNQSKEEKLSDAELLRAAKKAMLHMARYTIGRYACDVCLNRKDEHDMHCELSGNDCGKCSFISCKCRSCDTMHCNFRWEEGNTGGE